MRHASAQPELRRDITCATRRSFLVLLTGQFVVLQLYVLHGCAEAELRRDVACAARSFFLDCGTLVYQSSNMSKKVLTGQLVAVQAEVRHGSAEPELRRDVACAERRFFLFRGTLVYHCNQASFLKHKHTTRGPANAFDRPTVSNPTAISPPRTRQLVVAGVEVREMGEQPNLGWDAACQQGIRSPFRARIRKHTRTANHSTRERSRRSRSQPVQRVGNIKKLPTRAKETLSPAPLRR